MKACFFANVPRRQIEQIDFYRNDVTILERLGYKVTIAESIGEVFAARDSDLFYVWWWNRALGPAMIARAVKRPIVVSGVFDYFLPYPTRYDYVSRPAWQRWLLRSALRWADANLFTCEYELDLVSRFFSVRNPYLVYLAIDTDLYQRKLSPVRAKTILNISWAGAENARRKGLFEMIRALPLILHAHPDVNLVMAGRPGEALRPLQNSAKSLGVEHAVTFAGELTTEQKVRRMQEAALYLQPSMYEGFGSAVAEAMACGTPAACTDAGALPEVVGDTGMRIATPSPQSIARAVIDFFDKPVAELERMGDAARRHVEARFSFNRRLQSVAAVVSALRDRSSQFAGPE